MNTIYRLMYVLLIVGGLYFTVGCNSERDARIKRYCEEHMRDEKAANEKLADGIIAKRTDADVLRESGDIYDKMKADGMVRSVSREDFQQKHLEKWQAETTEQKRDDYMGLYRGELDSCINDTLAKAGQ
jgi:hypothetical protein